MILAIGSYSGADRAARAAMGADEIARLGDLAVGMWIALNRGIEPAIDARLTRLDNLLPLPHIGSATVETRAAMGELQRRNLAAVLAGAPPVTPVNRTAQEERGARR